MKDLNSPLRLRKNWKTKAFVREQLPPMRLRNPRF
jgi:hypothetical protein